MYRICKVNTHGKVFKRLLLIHVCYAATVNEMIRTKRLAISVRTHPRRMKSRACTLPASERDNRVFKSARISVKNSAAEVGLAKVATEEVVGVATSVLLVGAAFKLEGVTLEDTAVETGLGVAVVVRPTLLTVAVMPPVEVAECAVEEAEAVVPIVVLEGPAELEEPEELSEPISVVIGPSSM